MIAAETEGVCAKQNKILLSRKLDRGDWHAALRADPLLA
jgi:hypothetical protein